MSQILGRRRIGWAASVFAALIVILLAYGATGRASSPSPAAEGKVTLRIGLMEEPDNLNPYIGIQSTSYVIWRLNYDFLVGFDDEKLEPRPELATAWEVSDDGTEWTFTIRDDATWHDGSPSRRRRRLHVQLHP
jgi:ABC-type transport system substrate-binding protein